MMMNANTKAYHRAALPLTKLIKGWIHSPVGANYALPPIEHVDVTEKSQSQLDKNSTKFSTGYLQPYLSNLSPKEMQKTEGNPRAANLIKGSSSHALANLAAPALYSWSLI